MTFFGIKPKFLLALRLLLTGAFICVLLFAVLRPTRGNSVAMSFAGLTNSASGRVALALIGVSNAGPSVVILIEESTEVKKEARSLWERQSGRPLGARRLPPGSSTLLRTTYPPYDSAWRVCLRYKPVPRFADIRASGARCLRRLGLIALAKRVDFQATDPAGTITITTPEIRLDDVIFPKRNRENSLRLTVVPPEDRGQRL